LIEQPPKRFRVIDAARGLAALAVAWYHLTHSMGLIPKGTFLYESGTFGWVGVDAFFVISGFIIPYSLEKNRYRLSDYRRFLVKRIARLDPPYLASLLVYLGLAAYYAYATHTAFPFSAKRVLLHLGYLNVFFGYGWIDNVYWTLAIEVQYYVLVGLAFPLLADLRRFTFAMVPTCLILSLLLPSTGFFFRYSAVFLLGLANFHYKRGSISRPGFLLSVLFFGVCAVFRLGWMAGITSVLMSLAIAFLRKAPNLLVRFGSMSYSFYLFHGSVGYTALSFLLRRAPEIPFVLSVFIALAASVAVSSVAYRLIEVPSVHLASRIRFKRIQAATDELQTVALAI
jgi:peptidoglycan/LPS O-acetylase OafA/YrhL